MKLTTLAQHGRSLNLLKHSRYTATTASLSHQFEHPKRLDVDYAASGVNVWIFLTDYMKKYETVNHGQGFPNWHSPDFVKKAAIDAINANHNQYTIPSGHPLLVNKLVDIYSKRFGQSLTAKNVQTTIGACAAIENCCQAVLSEDDEVITFEPYFDFYKYQVMHCGAKLNAIPLSINSKTNKLRWEINLDLLDKTLSQNDKIKAIILNTPQNPTGCVTDKPTMDKLVKILQKYPKITVISDEVYEDIIFDDNEHIHIANYPGMFPRTLTVNSAAKKFR